MPDSGPQIGAGQIIGGAYQITELIGKGGFAEVWSALDIRLKRIVAVKIIPKNEADEQHGSQFKQEALLISRLEHHYILPLYDFGETDHFRYLVMRYVSGGTLADRIKSRAPTSPETVISWMMPIAAALDYIHEQRVVHRDIKPGNILFDNRNLPYLADFGLAKELSDYTQQIHSATGTFVYMPPEQFYGEALSIQSDQYNLGIMLYQFFTGTLPFNGDYAYGMRQLVTNEPLPDVTTINPQLPAELNAILASLTAAKPENRPASALQVLASIAQLFGQGDSALSMSLPLLTLALDSNSFHQHDAELLLEKHLADWSTDHYTLSRTHFMLLDMIFANNPGGLTSDGRSLLLRGAFENGQQFDLWWASCTDAERQRAAWSALNSPNRDLNWRAVSAVMSSVWAAEASAASLDKVAELLLPISDTTDQALTLLEHALPPVKVWPADASASTLDNHLQHVARSHSRFARRAAYLIGTARRTAAAQSLPTDTRDIGPLLSVYEAAGSLPRTPQMPAVWLLAILLMLRQLSTHPRSALQTFASAFVGSGIGLALMVYVVYRSYTLVDNVRVLNSIGQGLIFGAIYGFGVTLARHIRSELGSVIRPLRWLLAIACGSLILAFGFNLYQKLVYDDSLKFSVGMLCGALYVSGFVITVGMPRSVRIIGSMAGIMAAYLGPWALYLMPDSTLQPPFFFDDANPVGAVLLATIAALLTATITLSDVWLPFVRRVLTSRAPTAAAQPVSDGTLPITLDVGITRKFDSEALDKPASTPPETLRF